MGIFVDCVIWWSIFVDVKGGGGGVVWIFIDLLVLIFDMYDINMLFLCNILYFNVIFFVC